MWITVQVYQLTILKGTFIQLLNTYTHIKYLYSVKQLTQQVLPAPAMTKFAGEKHTLMRSLK